LGHATVAYGIDFLIFIGLNGHVTDIVPEVTPHATVKYLFPAVEKSLGYCRPGAPITAS
jgi:hypothetical protein